MGMGEREVTASVSTCLKKWVDRHSNISSSLFLSSFEANTCPLSCQVLCTRTVASLSSAGILTGGLRRRSKQGEEDNGGPVRRRHPHLSVNARALPIYAKTSSSLPPLSLLSLFVHFRLAHSLLALDEETRQDIQAWRRARA